MFREFPLLVLRVFTMVHRQLLQQQTHSVVASDQLPTSKVASIHGDVKIGVLFPLHQRGSGCNVIWEQYGIHRTEIALKTIDEINRNPRVLPNVKLGIEIRDSCWTERVAVEQTINFIQDVMETRAAPSQQQCCASGHDENCPTSQTSSGSVSSSQLVGVIGPGSSANSKAVQNLLQIFRIPQIGYSATSTDLSNKEDFRYFMRVVPSDAFQAQALIDIIRYFNWTYPTVLYSEGNYGEKGFEELEKRTKGFSNICIGFNRKIPNSARTETYDRILDELIRAKPKVVICFCEGGHASEVLKAIDRYVFLNPNNTTDVNFQWIGSESWGDRYDVVQSVEHVAMGSITLRIYSPSLPEFDNYFWALRPETNTRNPWFTEFWEQKFNCSLAAPSQAVYDKNCDGGEDLAESYGQDRKLAQVINSIYTIAYALDKMYRTRCGRINDISKCVAFSKIDGKELFFNYMMKVNFTKFEGMDVSFDSNGDPPARYEILNLQRQSDGTYDYIKVGEWAAARLLASQNFQNRIAFIKPVQYFNGNTSDMSDPPVAVCSAKCEIGQYRKYNRNDKKCCWVCFTCKDSEFIYSSLDGEECAPCPNGWWSTPDRTGCYKLEVEYLRWSAPSAIIATVFACVGIAAMIFTTFVFIRFNNTPVVKSTTRELSYIILFGVLLCYATTFVIILPPTNFTCYILRIVPGIAFSMMYGALLTKTNRIARILAGSKKIRTTRQRFMSLSAQLIITLIIVLIEVAILTATLIYLPAEAVEDYKYHKRVLLVCNTTSLGILAPFGFDFFLICMCTLYAVKTRNLPENFNEAKFIGFTMYTTCIIWLAFLAIYFGSDSQSITMSFSFSLSATVALVLLFFPKLYIMLFHPHKNDKSFFKTNDKIRMYRGGGASVGGESLRYYPRTVASTRMSSGLKNSFRSGNHHNMDQDTTLFRQRRAQVLKEFGTRESVHVPAPGAHSHRIHESLAVPHTSHIQKQEQTTTVISEEVQTITKGSRKPLHGQSELRDYKQLSVIEEGLTSHDSQSSATRSQPPSQSPGSPTGGGGKRRDTGAQTDIALIAELMRVWMKIEQQKQQRRAPPQLEQQSYKKGRGPRRSFSEYRRKPFKSKIVAKEDDEEEIPEELLQEVVAYRLQQYFDDGADRFCRSSPFESPSSSYYRQQQFLDRTESIDTDRRSHTRRHLLAETMTTAFETFLGTAVLIDDENGLAVDSYNNEDATTSEFFRRSIIAEGLGTSVDPLISPAVVSGGPASGPTTVVTTKGAKTVGDSPRSSQGSASPRLRRHGSVLARLGYSIKKKFKKPGHIGPSRDNSREDRTTSVFSEDRPFDSLDECEHRNSITSMRPPTPNFERDRRYVVKTSSSSSSFLCDPRHSTEQTRQTMMRKVSADVRPPEPVLEEDGEEWSSGGGGGSRKRKPMVPRTESQDSAQDSGFISRHVSERMTSMESGDLTTDSHSWRQSSGNSKHGSVRERIVEEDHLAPGPGPNPTPAPSPVLVPAPVVCNGNGDLEKLQTLLQSQGLNIQLTESTLV